MIDYQYKVCKNVTTSKPLSDYHRSRSYLDIFGELLPYYVTFGENGLGSGIGERRDLDYYSTLTRIPIIELAIEMFHG